LIIGRIFVIVGPKKAVGFMRPTSIHPVTPDEAVRVVKSGDHIHFSSVAMTPLCLVEALCRRGRTGELQDVHVHHLHTEGPAPYADRNLKVSSNWNPFLSAPTFAPRPNKAMPIISLFSLAKLSASTGKSIFPATWP